jgi:hypothetical protein
VGGGVVDQNLQIIDHGHGNAKHWVWKSYKLIKRQSLLQELFSNLVVNFSRIKIMMGMGNELVEQLTSNQTLTDEKINRIFTQRTIWLLPCMSLMNSDDDHELLFTQVRFV